MPTLVLPVTLCDDNNAGADAAVSAVEGTVTLSAGYYKIGADGVSLKWRLGDTAVTASIGSLLADGDQEVIYVPADNTDLRFITSQGSTNASGFINYVPINIQEIPGVDPAQYL